MRHGDGISRTIGLALALALLAPAATMGQDAPRPKSISERRGRDDAPKPAPKKDEAPKAETRETPADDAEKPEAEAKGERPARGFLGDPSRFTRFGGWGSMGGMIGQYGMARTALISMPPVQEELKLTDRQKADIRKWMEGLRTRGEEMGRSMRDQAREQERQGDVPIAARIMQFTSMMNQVGDLLRENENGLAKILDAGQRKRLTQISLQMEGIGAITRPDVAYALNMSPEQQELIAQIIAEGRMQQMGTWIEQGMAMSRQARDRRAAESGQAPAAARPAAKGRSTARRGAPEPDRPEPKAEARAEPAPRGEEDPDETPEARAARRERERAMQAQFESMRDRTDRIQDQTTTRILKVLTRRQRANFDKMLGEPFDPSTINSMGMGRPPGDRQRSYGESER